MIVAADNLQITRPEIAAAVENFDPEPVMAMAKACAAAGADWIDINSGPLSRDPEKKMVFLVEAVQAATDLPLMLDSTNPRALEAGLKACRKPPVINGFSLEPEKIAHILPLAKTHAADIIGYLLYPNSHVPVDASDALAIALDLYDAFRTAGLENSALIIDPVIAPVIWENGLHHNREILSVIHQLPDLLGFPVRTIAGLSNLTTGGGPMGKRRLLERTFLPMLAASGLSMVLMNVFHEQTVTTARTCTALTGNSIFTWAGLAD